MRGGVRDIPLGTRFGRLVTTSLVFSAPYGSSSKLRGYVHVHCDCGQEKTVLGRNLREGRTTACGGCRGVHRHTSRTRGASREYRTWNHMVGRCTNPNNDRWMAYGGRGITVCERWRSFPNFLEDMGERPPDHTLERIDNDGNYEPANCRWATVTEQNRNYRRNRVLTHDGVSMPVVVWAEKLGMSPSTIYTRLKRGWSVEDALDPTNRKHNPRKHQVDA